jgi:hypothetical protein
MSTETFISTKDFFEQLFDEDSLEECSRGNNSKEGFSEPLFNKIKAKMIMRIHGVTPKMRRKAIASTVTTTRKKRCK